MRKGLFVLLIGLAWGIGPRTTHKRGDLPFNSRDVCRTVTATRNPAPSGGSFGDAFLIDTTIQYLPRHSEQFEPGVAFDGGVYLVVWSDARYGVRASRVTRGGVVLDPVGIRIPGNADDDAYPVVAFNSLDFMVAWAGYPGVLGCRVTSSGQVRDPQALVIGDSIAPGTPLSIATDGHDCLVVWTNFFNGSQYDINGARVTQSGEVLDPAGIPISTRPGVQTSPAVAYDGANFLVAWQDYRNGTTSDIYGARIDTSGIVLDSSGFPISLGPSSQLNPALCYGDSSYLAVWEDVRLGAARDVFCARITPGAQVLDTSGIPVTTAPDHQVLPRVAFGAHEFLIDWVDWRNGASDIYGARVSPAGAVLDSAGIPITRAPDYQGDPGIAFGDTTYLAVWHDYRYGDYSQVFAARVARSGTVVDTAGFLVSADRPVDQGFPAATFNGQDYLVAWMDDTTGKVYFERVSTAGRQQDSTRVPASAHAVVQAMPAVSAGAMSSLLVWQDDTLPDLRGTRIASDGTLLDTGGIAIDNWHSSHLDPAVAFSGSEWLVVWHGPFAGTSPVRAARVDTSGAVLDSVGFPLALVYRSQVRPKVAFGDSIYCAVWQDDYVGIQAARVSRAGRSLDPLGIDLTTAATIQVGPDIAFGGSNFLVTWLDDPESLYPARICGARLSLSGTVLDTSPMVILSPAYSDYGGPSVTFDGVDYVVASYCHSDSGDGVFAAKVRPDGTVQGPVLVAPVYTTSPPVVARGPADQVLVLYRTWTDSVAGRPVDADRIWGRMSPFVGIGEAASAPGGLQKGLRVFPTPFSSQVQIVLPSAVLLDGKSGVTIFDVQGRLVKTLARGISAGRVLPAVTWDGSDESGRKLPGGVYFVQVLTTGGQRLSGQVAIVR